MIQEPGRGVNRHPRKSLRTLTLCFTRIASLAVGSTLRQPGYRPEPVGVQSTAAGQRRDRSTTVLPVEEGDDELLRRRQRGDGTCIARSTADGRRTNLKKSVEELRT